MNLHHRPLFLLLSAYVAGIVCAGLTRAWLILGLLAVSYAAIAVLRSHRRTVSGPVVGLLAVVFAIGFMRASAQSEVSPDDISHYAEEKMVHLTGAVASDIEPAGDGARFIVRTSSVKTYAGEYPVTGRVMVRLRHPRYSDEEGRVPFYGETVRIHGRLVHPRPASNPGSFDYGDYLARKRVFCMISGYTTETEVLRRSSPGPRSLALRFKARLESLSSSLLPHTNAGLLLGILLGNYATLPMDVQAAFMRSGTMHLLAASGYNCAVIIGIFGLLLTRLTSPRVLTHITLILLVWGFTLVVGPCPSIVRAAVMVTVFLSAYLIRRVPDTYNIVCAAALIILAVNPLDIYDIGFQLSFAAVFAIVTVMPLAEPTVQRLLTLSPRVWERTPGRLSGLVTWASRNIVLAVVLSAVAGLWTWPITAYYFNYLSLISIVANALVALLVVVLTTVGIAALVFGWIWPEIGHITVLPTEWVTEGILRIVIGLGTHSWSSLSMKSPSPTLILLYYITLLGALEYAHRKAAQAQRTTRTDRSGLGRPADMVLGTQPRR